MELAMELPVDLLISKLIWSHHLAWRGSNKAVSLSLKCRHPDSTVGAFQVYCVNGFQVTSHFGDLCFGSGNRLHN